MTESAPPSRPASPAPGQVALWNAEASFLNKLDGLEAVVLTTDVDWAPDYCVEHVLELVERHGHKINVFATHDSEVLKSPPSFVEVGLHPDYTRDGMSWREKAAALKELYPDAVASRSHRNVFGQNVSDWLTAAGIRVDLSTFLWNHAMLQAHRDYNGLLRIPYFWEDGIHMDMKFPWDWSTIRLDTPGVKILNVHPILIYLNCETDDQRRAVTSRYKDLTRAPKSEIDGHVREEYGIRDFWVEMLASLAERGVKTYTMREVLARA